MHNNNDHIVDMRGKPQEVINVYAQTGGLAIYLQMPNICRNQRKL